MHPTSSVTQPAAQENGDHANQHAECIAVRKHLEEQLAYHALILDHIHDAVIAYDQDLKIMSWNKGAEKLYGYSAEEALGRVVSHLLATELTEEERQRAIEKVAEAGHFSIEVAQYTKNGERIVVESHTIPLRDPSGQVIGYTTDNRDVTARKKVEEEREQLLLDLEKERNLWLATVDNMLDPVAICDAQGRATYMNKACAKLIQMEIHPDVDMERQADHYRLYHPDGTPFESYELPLQKAALENINVHNVEILHDSQNGEKCTLIWNAAPLRTEDGTLIGAIAVGRDITDQRVAEAAQASLFEENRRQKELAEEGHHTLESLMNYIPEGITIADAPDAKVRMISNYGCKLVGLRSEEIVGRSRTEWWKIYDPVDGTLASIEQMPLSRVIGNGELITDEEWLLENARGEKIPLICNAGPIRNLNGEIIGGISAWREIADRKRAEATLQESEERFRTMADGTPTIIWVTNVNGQIEFVNRAYAEFFGVTQEEVKVTGWQPLVHPDDHTAYVDEYVRCLREHRTFQAEARVRFQNGNWRWIYSHGEPRFSSSGEFMGMAGSSTDITDRKKAEQSVQEYSDRLREYSEQLEERVRDRTEELVNLQRRLVDNVEAERLWVSQELHDGPMQEIYALIYELSLIEGTPNDSEWQAEITSIKDKLKEINEGLRTVARELRPTSLTPFGLEKAIREHGERFDQEHPELQVMLDLMEDDNLLPEHIRLALFRIYQTALTNVIRHAQAKQISVKFSFDEQQVYFEIQDDGKGFEAPKRLRTFARQGHFGLAGAVERAEAIGGKLELESAPGEGTRLRVTAPVIKGS